MRRAVGQIGRDGPWIAAPLIAQANVPVRPATVVAAVVDEMFAMVVIERRMRPALVTVGLEGAADGERKPIGEAVIETQEHAAVADGARNRFWFRRKACGSGHTDAGRRSSIEPWPCGGTQADRRAGRVLATMAAASTTAASTWVHLIPRRRHIHVGARLLMACAATTTG